MANRLAGETSPYLRQHADNPVDWYPWGPEAFAEAERRDVPVLLSVGYSSCHWCHVMAHESFEDEAIAELMNRLFVNVKVDREERPDVDAIYMDAVQAMHGHGGWPMTVFLMPDGRPFYAGTYFPPQTRGQNIGFVELCNRISDVWTTRRDDLTDQADQLVDSIGQVSRLEGGDQPPGPEVFGPVRAGMAQSFDGTWGGFGTAPKFPNAMALDHLISDHLASGDPKSLDMAVTTLDAMAAGGIFDHLGGGFARYSVDQRWLVPHFEKMLYDQALLGRVYLHAWQVTGDERHLRVLRSIVEYVLRDLALPGGGFASAEDADSEGEEGRFYVWSLDEVRSVLAAGGLDERAIAEAVAWWGVTEGGNFEGSNILYRPDRSGDAPGAVVEEARQVLLEHRSTRVRPGLDDKALTEWNGYLLATLAEAAAATGDAEWLAAAVACGEFLIGELLGDDGRWLRSWQAEGGARHLAYAADHAALVDAFTRLAEATGQARWITAATATADALLELFWDHQRGGLFTTGSDAEALVTRPKDLIDNATPSSNGMAATALLRLSALTGEDRYRDRAGEILTLLAPLVERHPTGFAQLLAAVRLWNEPTQEIVVSGTAPELVEVVTTRFRPTTVLAWGEPYDSPLWAGREPGGDGLAKAFVCRNHTCQLPVTTTDDLRSQLGDT